MVVAAISWSKTNSPSGSQTRRMGNGKGMDDLLCFASGIDFHKRMLSRCVQNHALNFSIWLQSLDKLLLIHTVRNTTDKDGSGVNVDTSLRDALVNECLLLPVVGVRWNISLTFDVCWLRVGSVIAIWRSVSLSAKIAASAASFTSVSEVVVHKVTLVVSHICSVAAHVAIVAAVAAAVVVGQFVHVLKQLENGIWIRRVH